MATIIIPNFLTQKVVDGLNTYQYTIQNAGMHLCDCKVDHDGTSQLTISIVQAGSVNATLATITLPGNTDGNAVSTTPLQALANCAINDTISFTLTSSAAIDNQLNTVKARLNVHQGTV